MKKLIALGLALSLTILVAGCSSKSDSSSTANAGNAKVGATKVIASILKHPPHPNATPIIIRITGDDEINKDVDIVKVLHPNYAEINEKFKTDHEKTEDSGSVIRVELEDLNIPEIMEKPGLYSCEILEPGGPNGMFEIKKKDFANNEGAERNNLHVVLIAERYITKYTSTTPEQVKKFLADAVANTNKASDIEEIKKIKDTIEKRIKISEAALAKIEELQKTKQYKANGVIRIIDSPKTAALWLELSDDEAKAYMEVLHKIDPQATQFPHLVSPAGVPDAASFEDVKSKTHSAKSAVLLPSDFAAKYENESVILGTPENTNEIKWYSDQRLKQSIPAFNQYQLYVLGETIQEITPPKP